MPPLNLLQNAISFSLVGNIVGSKDNESSFFGRDDVKASRSKERSCVSVVDVVIGRSRVAVLAMVREKNEVSARGDKGDAKERTCLEF